MIDSIIDLVIISLNASSMQICTEINILSQPKRWFIENGLYSTGLYISQSYKSLRVIRWCIVNNSGDTIKSIAPLVTLQDFCEILLRDAVGNLF